MEQGWLQDMIAYWADGFDWRAQEAEMNSLPQFRVTIDGVPIHFVHLRSGRPDAIPLILTHGWPWTFWDWRDVIRPLVAGDGEGPVFDVVVPSLPGFGFSAPLRTTGVNARRVGEIWVRLMRDVLGYASFAAAGGDWGSMITAELGHAHADVVRAVHMTLPVFPGYGREPVPEDAFAPDERWMIDRSIEVAPLIASHLTVHSNDPQTLAYALADSPAGTAAWLWERRRAWSDCGGDIVAYHGRDALCTLASIYWLTNTIGSSLRIYKEHFGVTGDLAKVWPPLHDRRPIVEAPAGFVVAPKELVLRPRSLVAAQTNLKRWTMLPRGGHFAPAEVPGLMVDEYRAFFGEHARG